MLVSPNGGGNGFGNGFGGDGWWIILLFILLAGNGGWGNGFGGGAPVYNDLQRGFDQSALTSAITGVQNGVNGLATQLCNGFAGVNATINATAANAETAANARAMSSMQQLFGLSQQFSDCCCENRLATAGLNTTIAKEACDNRYAAAQNTRDIIESGNRNNQAILDKLCQLELDAKNDRIAELERQLTAANLSASQTAQTARILADNAAQTVALEQYLNPVPVPAYVVQNPNCCYNSGCGCNG